jgi:mannan endo-1,4-beta-mannosidase
MHCPVFVFHITDYLLESGFITDVVEKWIIIHVLHQPGTGREIEIFVMFALMKTLKYLLIFLFVTLSLSCSQEPQRFVRVDNMHFTLDGEPYYFFGANLWYGAYLAADLVEGDRDRLFRELDLLAEHRITNLRVMAATELSDLKMSVKPAFNEGNGSYNEQLLEGLDLLLVEMARRKMQAVLVLNNYWQWSGGMAQYLNWSTGEQVIDPDLTGDWQGFMAQSARFYADERANQMYRDYISVLVNRVNSISRIKYSDDPTIMSWQLANEPRPAPDAAGNQTHATQYVEWVHETAEFIHSLDPNHLVSTGSEGIFGSVQSRAIYMDAHRSPYVDYLTFHIWPSNWGWYDPSDPRTTFERSVENTLLYFDEHVNLARELNKPTVLEEFGLNRDSGSFSPEATTHYRDAYLSQLFAAVVDSALAGSPVAGLNFWAWGGEGKALHEDYIWRPGDSFTGDPPQEAQGLFSVFSTDTSTLRVFLKYDQALDALGQE